MFCTVSDMRPPRPLQSLGQGVSGEVLPAEADKSPSHLIYQAGQMYPADEVLQHVFGIIPPGGLYCISSARLDSFFKETRSPVNSRLLSAWKPDSEPLCSAPYAGRVKRENYAFPLLLPVVLRRGLTLFMAKGSLLDPVVWPFWVYVMRLS